MPAPTNLGPILPSRALVLLRAREWEVLMYLSDGLSNEEIAAKLYVTPKSVQNYCTRIGEKLQQKGAGKLFQFAQKHRIALRYWYQTIRGKLPPR